MRSGAWKSLFLIASLIVSAPTYAQNKKWGSGIDFTQRAANREKSRWSLTDWLAMKDRNRMMDMWLSVNAPSPFEVSLGGAYQSYKTQNAGDESSSQSFSSYAADFAAYAQFIGVGAEYQSSADEGLNDIAGMLNIRLLGNSIQNTSVTLHIGQRTRQIEGQENLVQNFGQASVQVYLTKYFGLDGRIRYYQPQSETALGEVKTNAAELGLFIDFKALRIFGTLYQEDQSSKTSEPAEPVKLERSGIKSGLKIFF